MNLLYMKYFCDAVRLGGVTAASKANFVTQSAVSQGIAKLEQMMGCSLLARHPNRFRLTPEGQEAFQRMYAILKQVDDFQQNFSEEHKGIIGSLDFACTFSFGLTVIPSYLKRFRSGYPDAEVNFICSGNLEEIRHLLKAGTIDFGIVPQIGNLDFSEFEQRIICQGKYGLYRSAQIEKKQLPSLGFILSSPEDTTSFNEAHLKAYGKEPKISFKVKSWVVAANLVSEGLGIGYFPDYIAEAKGASFRMHKSKLVLPSYKLLVIYPKSMKLRKSSEIFLSKFNIKSKKF